MDLDFDPTESGRPARTQRAPTLIQVGSALAEYARRKYEWFESKFLFVIGTSVIIEFVIELLGPHFFEVRFHIPEIYPHYITIIIRYILIALHYIAAAITLIYVVHYLARKLRTGGTPNII
jgi:hypothetical protein